MGMQHVHIGQHTVRRFRAGVAGMGSFDSWRPIMAGGRSPVKTPGGPSKPLGAGAAAC